MPPRRSPYSNNIVKVLAFGGTDREFHPEIYNRSGRHIRKESLDGTGVCDFEGLVIVCIYPGDFLLHKNAGLHRTREQNQPEKGGNGPHPAF